MSRLLCIACLIGWSALVWADSQRDPTRPLDYRVSRESVSLTLNAIMAGDSRRLAIINGQSLTAGEMIANTGGVRLLQVESHSVIVGQSGRQWRLNLNDESVRRTRPAEQ